MNPSKLIPKLLIGVMIISAPIFAAIRAAAVGVNIAELWPWYYTVEIISGAALVLMEGGALYVVSSYWRQFKTFSAYWNILGAIMAVMALAIPFIVTAFFVSSQFNEPIYRVLTWNHILNNHLVWLWSFSVACIPTILVIGLGIAHGVEKELPQEPARIQENYRAEAFGIIAQAHQRNTWIYPPALVASMGGKINEAQAVGYLSEWYSNLPKKRGVKSSEEKEFMEALQPVSIHPEEVEGTYGRNGDGKGRVS